MGIKIIVDKDNTGKQIDKNLLNTVLLERFPPLTSSLLYFLTITAIWETFIVKHELYFEAQNQSLIIINDMPEDFCNYMYGYLFPDLEMIKISHRTLNLIVTFYLRLLQVKS